MHKDFVGSGVDKVKGALGFAYGKDRVPYDNYPAILHAGEKVLTRNQADQYERQMSTRGVQLKDVTPLDRDSSGDSSNTQVQTVQGGDTGNSKSGNWSINIGDITFPNAQMGSERDVKATADELVTEIVACPSSRTFPVVGGNSPPRIFRRVDFPLPLEPMMDANSPFQIVRSLAFNA